ncbi:hypothetical protein [Actinocrispum wychmicini]|uniref:Uncharacterized protein n=1 Tax=Actinocrispum wychmicini TaxID=1213861 RepID=A0A4R2JLM8_9PSEU|nr:hypothetical protein [Actinocrispum wychmicini]TCO59502.1 hypothetical protein EV192_104344 [Actinocrispum wychmicini]
MSNDEGSKQAVGGQVAVMGAGVALSEALFFACLAGFVHPRSLWQFGMPWVLLPALPALGALGGLVVASRKPARAKVFAVALGALLASLTLLAAGLLVLLLDRGLSD